MQEVFEKIIEKLEKIRVKKTCKKEKCDTKELCRICVVDDAIEIVKQAAAEHNNGWIPCSDRLPKYGEVVMCSCTNSGITISCITHKGVKPSKSVRFGQHSVIAWQPLPAPYQPTRKNCSNRHENGNCLVIGGFCTAVDDKYCKYHKKKTNFDVCCESMETMAQIIDIAKIGWTKEQIIEWLQKEECEVSAPYQPNGDYDENTN